MKSTEIYNELQTVLVRIRTLNAEADACQPIRRDWRLTDKENDENYRRATRLVIIVAEIGRANAEATRLRKEYAAAMAEEQFAPVAFAPTVSAEMAKMWESREACTDDLIALHAERMLNALPAASGDKEAKAAMDRIAKDEELAWRRKQDVDVALIILEARESEVRQEFTDRGLDARFVAARDHADAITANDRSIDIIMRSLAEHLQKRKELLRNIRKTGASFDDSRLNTLQTVQVLHRAAAAAGLAQLLDISIRDAVPLEDASRTLLRLAIRRPDTKGRAA